jgi:hypothetical protein
MVEKCCPSVFFDSSFSWINDLLACSLMIEGVYGQEILASCFIQLSVSYPSKTSFQPIISVIFWIMFDHQFFAWLTYVQITDATIINLDGD